MSTREQEVKPPRKHRQCCSVSFQRLNTGQIKSCCFRHTRCCGCGRSRTQLVVVSGVIGCRQTSLCNRALGRAAPVLADNAHERAHSSRAVAGPQLALRRRIQSPVILRAFFSLTSSRKVIEGHRRGRTPEPTASAAAYPRNPGFRTVRVSGRPDGNSYAPAKRSQGAIGASCFPCRRALGPDERHRTAPFLSARLNRHCRAEGEKS